MPEIAISVNNISKNYGNITAIDKLSFEIGKGELFGFIGPDGGRENHAFQNTYHAFVT